MSDSSACGWKSTGARVTVWCQRAPLYLSLRFRGMNKRSYHEKFDVPAVAIDQVPTSFLTTWLSRPVFRSGLIRLPALLRQARTWRRPTQRGCRGPDNCLLTRHGRSKLGAPDDRLDTASRRTDFQPTRLGRSTLTYVTQRSASMDCRSRHQSHRIEPKKS